MNINEIEKRATAATPGPWYEDHAELWSHGNFIGLIMHRSFDAEFIAHAREDIPALIAELLAQTERADDLMKLAEKMNVVDLVKENLRLSNEIRHCEVDLKIQTERADRAEREKDAAIRDINLLGKNYNGCHACDMETDLEGCLKRRKKLPRSVSCFEWRGMEENKGEV